MITGWGGSSRLARYVGIAKAKEPIFCADLISAADAQEIGLGNHIVTESRFFEEVLAFSRRIARNAPIDGGRQMGGNDRSHLHR